MSAARAADVSHHTPHTCACVCVWLDLSWGRKWPSLTAFSLLFTCRNGFDTAFCLFGVIRFKKMHHRVGCQATEPSALRSKGLPRRQLHAYPVTKPASGRQPVNHKLWNSKLFQNQIRVDRFIVRAKIPLSCWRDQQSDLKLEIHFFLHKYYFLQHKKLLLAFRLYSRIISFTF